MRGLSLLQPWASLMAAGAKTVETRSWDTQYRGLVAIAASARWDKEAREFSVEFCTEVVGSPDRLPRGAVVAVGELVTCWPTVAFTPKLEEAPWGNYAPGRYAWVFKNVRSLREPIPVKGSLGLYTLSSDVFAAIDRQLKSLA